MCILFQDWPRATQLVEAVCVQLIRSYAFVFSQESTIVSSTIPSICDKPTRYLYLVGTRRAIVQNRLGFLSMGMSVAETGWTPTRDELLALGTLCSWP